MDCIAWWSIRKLPITFGECAACTTLSSSLSLSHTHTHSLSLLMCLFIVYFLSLPSELHNRLDVRFVNKNIPHDKGFVLTLKHKMTYTEVSEIPSPLSPSPLSPSPLSPSPLSPSYHHHYYLYTAHLLEVCHWYESFIGHHEGVSLLLWGTAVMATSPSPALYHTHLYSVHFLWDHFTDRLLQWEYVHYSVAHHIEQPVPKWSCSMYCTV